MSKILVVGASRGLGNELLKEYAKAPKNTVVATSRSDKSEESSGNIKWISGIDVASESAGSKLAAHSKNSGPFDIVIITAGYFGTESFDEPKWEAQIQMYTTSAVGPVFLVHHLVKAGLVAKGAKIILVSSESGSITLRHESEGGGNYGHHASKSALNMVGKLLSLDLKERAIAVGIIHPGFMRTEMTKGIEPFVLFLRNLAYSYNIGVGFDKFWEDGGAVHPTEAAISLIEFIEGFTLENSGQYWAPRGPRDIGTAEAVLGKGLPTPLQLPW